MSKQLTISRPDDWHLHLRDGEALNAVAPHSARQFKRAIIMPNLTPPVTTTAMALDYRQRILAALPGDTDFEPLMTLYLTDNTATGELEAAKASGHIPACKLYPAGATTNSDHGVTDIKHIYPALEAMQRLGLVLCVHGEVTSPEIDIFDREAVFIDRVLTPVTRDFPELKVVLEHITTREAADFVADADRHVGATITPQHLLYNRNEIFTGGVRPHYYCLPILKREIHRQSLVKAATSGNPKYFLGTDSAPHARGRKETACGCAGCYSGFHALELYATAFESAGALDKLEGFAAFYGADFYGLPRNETSVTLKREVLEIPESLPYESDVLVPLAAGGRLEWRLESK